MNTRYGAANRTRVHYGAPGGNAGWQQSTGLLHLDRFESVPPGYKKREPQVGVLFFWCRRQDSITLKCEFRRAGIQQQSTGLLHLHGFESVPPGYQKREPPVGVLFFGAGDRTRTGTLSPAVDFESRG